jgi:arginine decarboxylase
MTRIEAEPKPSGGGAPRWTVGDAAELYRVEQWGAGYFGVNDQGHVVAYPYPEEGDLSEVDLLEVVEGLRQRGIGAPVLLRFTDVLEHRLRHINAAFASAIEENAFRGRYRAVYPIKVNQQHHVVEELSRYGRELGVGLEVGSKPELLAVMAMSAGAHSPLIVCNGFKDAQYIEAVVLASKLGREIVPVVENLDELRLIIEHAERYEVRPAIGVRVKLASEGAGRWKGSSGSKSKFGLFMSELLEAVAELRRHDMLDSLRLLHCHNGSQVQDIRVIKSALTELAHVYVELKKMGAGLEILDIGGGLGVDYRGERSNTDSSMNYSVEEFASDVVYRVGRICDAAEIDHPDIVTECGRAMVAYSSVLVTDVQGSTGPAHFVDPPDLTDLDTPRAKIPQPLLDLHDAYESVEEGRLLECYHDALTARESALSLFSLGYLTLPMRAAMERLFWATCARLREARERFDDDAEELLQLDAVLSDVYFCNFSLFQSLPDAWAIDQLFPIMPIHRLREEPSRKAILADITCDSDGKLDQFIGDGETTSTLDVHPLDGSPYYLGIFLVGAYQETLGDLHNLFGDTHAVHIRLDDEGEWAIEEVVKGDTSAEVLAYVQFDTQRCARDLQRDCERAVKRGRLSAEETRRLMSFYEGGLNSYTYLIAPGQP